MAALTIATVNCQLDTAKLDSAEMGASGAGLESSELEPAQQAVGQRRKASSSGIGSSTAPTTTTTTTTTRGSNRNATNSSDMIVHEREFVSPQARVQMDCQRDKTIIRVNFTRPFNGIISAGKLETSKCKLNGNGTSYYELHVSHNESQCDTEWDSVNSSIFNTLFIRFHSSLETGSDIAKNIMCRLTVGDLVVGKRPSVKMMHQQNTSSSTDNSNNKPKRQTA